MAVRRLHQLQLVLSRCGQQPFSTHHPLSTNFFQITPKASRFDEKIDIRVQGLPSQAKVTLQASVENEWRRVPVQFVSCGHYVSNAAGEVELGKDPSIGGTYTGVEPMGLFWSMKPSPSGQQNIRMTIKNVELPVVYNLSVFSGHLTLDELDSDGAKHQPISTMTLERTVMPADVRRIPVKEGSVRGTLFLPPGEGPFPGVVDMFGLAGGLAESRAAMLAAHGFAAYALPLFGYDDLPEKLADQTFDYFQSAIQWISSHPSIRPGGVGLIATSGGASLATMITWVCPEVKAFIRISGSGFWGLMDLYHKGQLLRHGVRLDPKKTYKDEGALVLKHAWVYTDADFIPLWERDVHLMAIVNGDDGQITPDAEDRYRNMYPEDRRHLVEVVHYPRAGHLLEPPYTPLCRTCYNPHFGDNMFWGGYTVEHAAAQNDSWNRILNFFRKHLTA